MNRFPPSSTATPYGLFSCASVAGPPSPEKQQVALPLLPATVVMIPSIATFRIRRFLVSAMKRLPALSTARQHGSFSSALVAGPPSPEKSLLGLPAILVMIPLGEIFWTPSKLTTNRSPSVPTAKPPVGRAIVVMM